MIDLNPEVENQVNVHAAREGVSASDLIARLLQAAELAPHRFAPRLRVLPSEQVKRQNAASIAYLEAQLAATENAAPEEIAAAEQEWQIFQQSLNNSRRATGERPLYKEDA